MLVLKMATNGRPLCSQLLSALEFSWLVVLVDASARACRARKAYCPPWCVVQATVCARAGLECIVYMGAKDMERQALNVFRMRLMGAEVSRGLGCWGRIPRLMWKGTNGGAFGASRPRCWAACCVLVRWRG